MGSPDGEFVLAAELLVAALPTSLGSVAHASGVIASIEFPPYLLGFHDRVAPRLLFAVR